MAINLSAKKPNSANKRSHACNKTKKQQKLNLQVERLADGTKVRLTARERKTLRRAEKAA